MAYLILNLKDRQLIEFLLGNSWVILLFGHLENELLNQEMKMKSGMKCKDNLIKKV